MESCGSFCITEKSDWKKPPRNLPPEESATAGDPHRDYIGASLDREALSLYMFTYTARETAEAGLMYYRARYLSTGIGRFNSEDPLGFNAASASFYAYAQNGPVYSTDPLGLQAMGGRTRWHHKKCPPRYSLGKISASPKMCRDDDFNFAHGTLHCYRELDTGLHICYDGSGGCEFHFDYTSPCTERGLDGRCITCPPVPVIEHTLDDFFDKWGDIYINGGGGGGGGGGAGGGACSPNPCCSASS